MNKVSYDGLQLTAEKRKYTNGRTALVLVDPNGEFGPEDYLVATVNLPDEACPEGFVFVKDYSEKEGVLKALMFSGIVSAPIRAVRSGFVSIPQCKLLA